MSAITSVATTLRRISADDSATIALAIRKVSAEYRPIADKDYIVVDPNLDELFQVYSQSGATYWVAEQNGKVTGGGGVAPLGCSEPDICGLQKIYFLSSTCSQGLAKKLALMTLEYAREQGFRQCYLETAALLTKTIRLYEHLGFEYISEAPGCTGHVDCEVRMLKPL